MIAFGAGVFRAASFTGDMNHRWARRVALSVAVLVEKTISGLEELRAHTNEILPQGAFNPTEAIANPAPLVSDAQACTQTYQASLRMGSDFRRLLRLGPTFVAALIGSGIGIAALTLHYAELLNWSWLHAVGFAVLGLAAVVLLVAGAVYIFLQDRLSRAEILAGTGGREGDGERE